MSTRFTKKVRDFSTFFIAPIKPVKNSLPVKYIAIFFIKSDYNTF
nr:MAG TPA: hypothetical protein [Caudoviricetes sp.]